jgi:hypothetical protein
VRPASGRYRRVNRSQKIGEMWVSSPRWSTILAVRRNLRRAGRLSTFGVAMTATPSDESSWATRREPDRPLQMLDHLDGGHEREFAFSKDAIEVGVIEVQSHERQSRVKVIGVTVHGQDVESEIAETCGEGARTGAEVNRPRS